MTLHTERLVALIEFAKQTTQLKKTPLQNISQHKDFSRLEERAQGIPGITFNSDDSEYGEVWLRLDRLHESAPPQPENKLLEAWIELPRNPNKEPSLKSHAVRKTLIDIGALSVDSTNAATIDGEMGSQQKESIVIALEDYPKQELLKSQLKSYIGVVWKPWAEKEKEIRKSIALYSELFMLSQKMQGNLLDSQLELVWGVGIAVWVTPAGNLTYPLLTQLVEISLNEQTMAIEIRPRQTEPRLEVDIYSSMDNPGVAKLVATSKRFFEELGSNLNPFEPSTFEPLLQSAAAFLDASGVYWPTQTTADDRKLPKPAENLVLTDTWVLFARPRTNNLLVQDLERFGLLLSKEDLDSLPGAVKALVTEPSSTIQEVNLPPYRGLSVVTGSQGDGAIGGKVSELYFPKAYNDEQVQIIQMLEVHDGVVVQGPPGTGKTHTIANVICHYLALGKRVLVTSMKDPALSVLQEKLPDSIRPLAISLLTSEAEGMKQFEYAINKISSEVTRIDRIAYRREIEQIDGQIDSLHGRISKADKDIATWARLNIDKVKLDDETLTPIEVAEEVARQRNEIEWFPDTLSIESEHRPQFANDDICALRDARAALGADLAYLGKKIPLIASFPETEKLLQVHQDLSKLSELKEQESKGQVPSLINTKPETIQTAMSIASKVSNLRLLLQEIENAKQSWVIGLQQYLRRSNSYEVLELFKALTVEILSASESRKKFLARPIKLPEAVDTSNELIEAITNLANGKKPFGLAGLFGKSEQKKQLDNITIVGVSASSEDDWKHILNFVQFQKHCKSLLVRWNALTDEISIPRFEVKPEHLQSACNAINLYEKIAKSLTEETETVVAIKQLLPSWLAASQTPYTQETLLEAESILQHHLTRQRLAETWLVKESFMKALFSCEGEITSKINSFLNQYLGNPTYNESQIQDHWSQLLEQLRHIHGQTSYLNTVNSVTQLIESSGATSWAEKLRTEFHSGPTDDLLPDNWREVWRLCRLINFVDQIDGRHELKRLSALRTELEHDLSRLYQDAVNKRTWLKLAENATPDVRSALEAYRAAIKKIGKGTGIRAGRYRHDAQAAANRANSAIPCWIMPHYRICESLPSSLGSFDLVIIDEASQSDLTALPAILRAQKVLIVGDDKQVSPEGVGLEEEKIRSLMSRFLAQQVDIFRPQMSPERSIYDLFKTVFANSSVMLREHFRCAAPIIEYSKREFYGHELKPLRIPKASERLDPPLVDVHVTDGYRNKDVNLPEAQFIVDEIKTIVSNPALDGRTIGVVSLLGNEQAYKIMQMLTDELGEQVITRYKITCGDARTFQGKERDIMFLTMVASLGHAHAQTQEMVAQRFNVAASRARDRMYLVRSIGLEELSPADHLRAKLIQHFQAPFLQSEDDIENSRDLCESPFEREVFDILVERGYRVTPQIPVGAYRIDMVVEGDSDCRLAIECDGDRYHGPDQWDSDMRRQRILERAGWRFWRCFASTFVLHKNDVINDLIETLTSFGIHPSSLESNITSIHVESRKVQAFASSDNVMSVDVPPDDEPDEQVESLAIKETTLPADEVEVGDVIQYIDMAKPDDVVTVQITRAKDDFENGIVNESRPLAQALLGAGIGEEVSLHLVGSSGRKLQVVDIKRTANETTV
ncbi:AAA domain-containing protein [uncultured Deefgea sp.]|uniref:AAA domain-containing protein n=1 Tax=uncultured Deefgea sp. TaxID=1304914 RepID=UPI00259ADD55|nr:AAA domain-containing protein [uncultured Deefgea sp.]